MLPTKTWTKRHGSHAQNHWPARVLKIHRSCSSETVGVCDGTAYGQWQKAIWVPQKAAERYAGFHRGWTWKDAGGSNVLFHLEWPAWYARKLLQKQVRTSTIRFRSRKNFAQSRTSLFKKRRICAFSSKILLHRLLQIRHLQVKILYPQLLTKCVFHPNIFWVQASNCFTRWGKFSTTPPRHPATRWASAWTPNAVKSHAEAGGDRT